MRVTPGFPHLHPFIQCKARKRDKERGSETPETERLGEAKTSTPSSTVAACRRCHHTLSCRPVPNNTPGYSRFKPPPAARPITSPSSPSSPSCPLRPLCFAQHSSTSSRPLLHTPSCSLQRREPLEPPCRPRQRTTEECPPRGRPTMPKTAPPRLLCQSDSACLERATNAEGKQSNFVERSFLRSFVVVVIVLD